MAVVAATVVAAVVAAVAAATAGAGEGAVAGNRRGCASCRGNYRNTGLKLASLQRGPAQVQPLHYLPEKRETGSWGKESGDTHTASVGNRQESSVITTGTKTPGTDIHKLARL